MLVLALLACDPQPAEQAGPPGSLEDETTTEEEVSEAQDEGTSGPTFFDSGTLDTAGQLDTAPVSYAGPSYESCITDAECSPGDACTTVSGYAGQYCAPACDPGGDGSECQLDGLGFETTCLETARCARVCDGELEDGGCPDDLACAGYDDLELCVGEAAGTSGIYGTCTHPNTSGPDCPEGTTCFGGDYLGVDDGICLPYCEDYTCPDPEGNVDGSPYCYDIGLDYPICFLFCTPDATTCPDTQECFDTGYGVGICAPPGVTSPY